MKDEEWQTVTRGRKRGGMLCQHFGRHQCHELQCQHPQKDNELDVKTGVVCGGMPIATDKDMLQKEIFHLDRYSNANLGKGKITVDSGAAESVMPVDMLKEVQLKESIGSRSGVHYVAANGGRMPNLGEKQVYFKTKNGAESNVVFQVTHARKPLASVSKMVKKGNRVVFSPTGSYIENIATERRIDMEEVNGTYRIDVEYLSNDFRGRTRQI